jgi:3'(2'), 5'-bisphosphate nucleotidase
MPYTLPADLNITNSTIAKIVDLLITAGDMALAYKHAGNLQISYKSDNSPVTNADIAISDFLIKRLAELNKGICVVSEENDPPNIAGNIFWLLDPIDGTSKYIEGASGYTINLALISNNQPLVGFIYHPELNEMCYNDLDGVITVYDTKTREKTTLQKPEQQETIKVLIGKEQLNMVKLQNEQLFSKIYPSDQRNKMSMILHNHADVYYLYHQVMEWDTAAAHAILKSGGGDILEMDGEQLMYGKPSFCNPRIIVCNQVALKNKQIILKNN